MIGAARRFSKDVGACNACNGPTPEVTCVRWGSAAQSQEARFCDACVASLIAYTVDASRSKATHTRSISGVEFDTKPSRPQGVIARKAKGEPVTRRHVVKAKTKPKPRVPAKAYPATVPERT